MSRIGETKALIVEAVTEGVNTANAIALRLDLSRSMINFHLLELQRQGIVLPRKRRARGNEYELTSGDEG